MSKREELENAIANLEAQRALLGDATVDAAISGIRLQLAALEPERHTEDQRKQVTVLFADISEFTAMSEALDAEDVQTIINGLWQRVDQAILDQNGRIDKHIGDAVMALWGTAEAREDDAEQAVRAALAVRSAVRSFAEEYDVPLNVRIGLNTGPVLLGKVGITAEFTAMGDTVNVASRLENAAPLGTVLISQDTYNHVRGIFDVQAQPPLPLKGKSEPLPVYVVERAKPRAFRMETRGVEGLETRTIGRDDDLYQLQFIYETAVSHKQTQLVTIVGDAGVGKSRLSFEFEKWLEIRPEQIRFFKGRGSQQTQGIPHFLWRDALADRFQILDSDPLAIVRQKFVDGLTAVFPDDGEMKAHILGAWLGYDFSLSPYLHPIHDDPEQIKNRATLYLAQFFREIGGQQPIVILLEDIHWADGGSLDTAIDLVRRQSQLPLLVLCLSRPNLFERRPDWGEGYPAQTRINLAPLSGEDMRALVAEILRLVKPLPEILLDLLSKRAEGFPFYAEELVKMLIDDGVIVKDAKTWDVVPEQLLDLKIPGTLTGVLQARLDRLLAEEKLVLQQASIIGRVFWDQALAEFQSELASALAALQAKEFIYRQKDSAFMGTAEYIFKHNLLHDVTYETVLKRLRRQYHALVADWLITAAQANGRSDEYAPLIGEHFQLAGKLEMAAGWYGRAGQQAIAAFAQDEAVRYLTFALKFTPEENASDRFTLLVAREKAFDIKGDREAQRQDLDEMVNLAAQLSVAEQAVVSLREARYGEAVSDYDQAIHYAQKTIELGEHGDDPSLLVGGYWIWGMTLWRQGQFQLAEEKLQTGLQLAQKANDYHYMANCLHGLGSVAHLQGEYARAKTNYEKALVIRGEIGDRQGEGASLNNLGIVAVNEGDYEVARRHHKRALASRREIGDRRGQAMSLHNLGVVADKEGATNTARTYYEQALTIYRAIGDRQGEGMSLNNLGNVVDEQGDYDSAEAYYQQDLVIRREIGDRMGEGFCFLNLGLVMMNKGDYQGAQDYLKRSLAINQEIGSRDLEGASLHELGALMFFKGDFSSALEYYQQSSQIREELNESYYLVEDWAGLAQVKLALGDRESAQLFGLRVLDYLEDNPRLDGASNRLRTFQATWEVMQALGQPEVADELLNLAAHIMQEYLAENSDHGLQQMYLNQPHHGFLWQAWQEKSSP